jgi:tripeptide aminopeptidase
LGGDNKAGVAAILEILRLIRSKGIAHPPLRVIFTVAEEIGLLGAVAIPRKLLSARYGIVLDGGDINEIINRAPTQYSLSATVFGRAAHAGIHPEQGVNAIQAVSRAIAKMRLGRIDAETTANIGVIKGGRATNIIPDKVELKGEARSHNLDKLRRQVDQMERVLVSTCAKFGAQARVEIRQAYTAFEINKNSLLIKMAEAAVRSAGVEPAVKKTGGGSDANVFNAAGVQTIIMGVGADQVHTLGERLAIADLIKGTEIIVKLLEELSREKTH